MSSVQHGLVGHAVHNCRLNPLQATGMLVREFAGSPSTAAAQQQYKNVLHATWYSQNDAQVIMTRCFVPLPPSWWHSSSKKQQGKLVVVHSPAHGASQLAFGSKPHHAAKMLSELLRSCSCCRCCCPPHVPVPADSLPPATARQPPCQAAYWTQQQHHHL